MVRIKPKAYKKDIPIINQISRILFEITIPFLLYSPTFLWIFLFPENFSGGDWKGLGLERNRKSSSRSRSTISVHYAQYSRPIVMDGRANAILAIDQRNFTSIWISRAQRKTFLALIPASVLFDQPSRFHPPFHPLLPR